MEPVLLESRDGYFYARGAGPFQAAAALPHFRQVVEQCVKAGHSRLLIDMTGVSGEIELAVLYNLGVEMAHYREVIERLAMLSRPDQVQPDRFWQTVTRNRGLYTGVFTELEEAVKWVVAVNAPQTTA